VISPFEIRPASPGDTRSFLDLYRVVVAESRFVRTERVHRSTGFYRERFARPWTDDEAQILAVDGKRVVGHLGISREEHPTTRHVASLGMMVHPEWRGRGVGSALMEKALDWAREHAVEKVALSVYPDNDAARALYRKFGFVEEGRLTGHSKKAIGYRDEIVMGLWLIPKPDGGGS
jgi:L-phenylalanine/L-methionine N-acetyltransferase